jgi:hypothetical protein
MIAQPVEVNVVRALAEVAEAFIDLAASIRLVEGVQSANCTCWMRTEAEVADDQYSVGQGDGFRVEWYAEGLFLDGRSLSFSQELSWHHDLWTIDASVRAHGDDEEESILELPRRHATDSDDLVSEIDSQKRLLVSRLDHCISLFLKL